MTGEIITERSDCRSCGAPLAPILDLGLLRLNAFPATLDAIESVPRVPLHLMVCTSCGLVQLDCTVPPDWLYREYWYKSGVNEMMREELHDIVRDARARVSVGPHDYVLDIGANDGTLLRNYRTEIGVGGCPTLVAVEPAHNLAAPLREIADIVVHEYFPDCLTALLPRGGQYTIITAIACAYDTEDPVAFFEGIRTLLAPDGVAIIQFQDFGQQLEAAAFDNICHEHLTYYTLWSLMHITNRVGLEIIDCQQTAINGGSLRVTLKHPAYGPGRVHSRVGSQLIREMQLGLDTPTIRQGDHGAFTRFASNVGIARTQILAALDAALDENRVVDVYGASTKGNILLQVLGLSDAEMRQAIDRSPEKQGHRTITGIPIVGEAQAREDPADLWLCPIWQFRPSVLRREAWYLQQGGTILFPLPAVELVRTSWRAPQ